MSTANLFLEVEDVNDNAPVFEQKEYSRTVREGVTSFQPQLFVRVSVHFSDVTDLLMHCGFCIVSNFLTNKKINVLFYSSKPKHSVSCTNIYMYNVWKSVARTLSALNKAGILHVWLCLIDHDATSWKTPVIWNWYHSWPFSKSIGCMCYDKTDIFFDQTRASI